MNPILLPPGSGNDFMHCHWEVTRGGCAEPCDKTAHTFLVDIDHDEAAFPVCTTHAYRAPKRHWQTVPLHLVLRSWGHRGHPLYKELP